MHLNASKTANTHGIIIKQPGLDSRSSYHQPGDRDVGSTHPEGLQFPLRLVGELTEVQQKALLTCG